ncbi:MAG: hypothetical protein M3Z04_01300 [Chloroflexota bacterium]|nr:hypothetical protein [Chloroflexota bacterium]
MLIPQSLYGLQRDVKKTCLRAVTRLRRGAAWGEAIDADELLNTETTPGWLVLGGPNSDMGLERHFHLYYPMDTIRKAFFDNKLPHELEEGIFAAALETPWGTSCLIGQSYGLNTLWVRPPMRFAPFLSAVGRFWEPLNAVGPRYTAGVRDGRDLWAWPTNIKFVLARSGVPIEILNSPLPPGGLDALLDRLPEWQANAPVYPEGA